MTGDITEPLPVVVSYEDRPAAFPGAEILARSLAEHAPECELVLYSPSSELAGRLTDLPRVRWIRTEDLVGRGWNVKPAILARALETHQRAFWLDTDIAVTADLAPLLRRFAPEVLVVGQEFHVAGGHGGRLRAAAHGLTAVRNLPYHPNSGSVLASRAHLPLLAAWSRLLSGETYLAAQKLPVLRRPAAMLGDQDVLWALLASAEFAGLPVAYLQTGIDMLQDSGANGFSLRDRWLVLAGGRPAFVHALGAIKPWDFGSAPRLRPAGRYLAHLAYELSPYFEAARPYAGLLGDPAWLRRRSWVAKGLNAVCAGNIALRGLPLALPAALSAGYRRRARARS